MTKYGKLMQLKFPFYPIGYVYEDMLYDGSVFG